MLGSSSMLNPMSASLLHLVRLLHHLLVELVDECGLYNLWLMDGRGRDSWCGHRVEGRGLVARQGVALPPLGGIASFPVRALARAARGGRVGWSRYLHWLASGGWCRSLDGRHRRRSDYGNCAGGHHIVWVVSYRESCRALNCSGHLVCDKAGRISKCRGVVVPLQQRTKEGRDSVSR